MLTKLYVQNYALISELEVGFDGGFNVITGETGSGKSLLLGALGLLMGQNADFSKVGNKEKKCISEGTFDISKYGFKSFLLAADVDYEDLTIIRRELSASGKSRAFINDTPVKLSVLKSFSSQLIDIHSQHENAHIHSKDFLFHVLDTFSEVESELKKFREELGVYNGLKSELSDLKSKESQLKADRDYFEFQLKELSEVDLDALNLESLESELNLLNNAETIRGSVYLTSETLSNDDGGALDLVKNALASLESIKHPDAELTALLERLASVKLELEDLSYDMAKKYEQIVPDEERLAELSDVINSVNTLLLKHRASEVSELIEKREFFSTSLSKADNFDAEIDALQFKIATKEQLITKLCKDITTKRKKASPQLENFINSGLADLSMPQAEFKVGIAALAQFDQYGSDELSFLVKTNKGATLSPISKVASGGEISRVMFLIKAAVASKKSIKTLVLDEIDTGISGEVASKLAAQIKLMSKDSQILVVSHLAQMASKADAHYKVYKQEMEESTETILKRLGNKAEVLNELAQLLSGEKVTEAALKNAASLLSEN